MSRQRFTRGRIEIMAFESELRDMQFGWINVFGIIIVSVMLIPNILYCIKIKNFQNRYENAAVNMAEQIGRYLSMALMIFPIGISGFSNVGCMLVYLIANTVLLLLYLIIWLFYFKSKSLHKALLLAIIPMVIFLISGITLTHWGLILVSVIFGISHIIVTYKNNC